MAHEIKPLVVKIFADHNKELFWPHSHVPRVGEVISMKTGDDFTVRGVAYNLVDHLHVFEAIVHVSK
jgi:hypothetical protein